MFLGDPFRPELILSARVVDVSEFVETLMDIDLKRLGSLAGYAFMAEKEDDLMDVDLMDDHEDF